MQVETYCLLCWTWGCFVRAIMYVRTCHWLCAVYGHLRDFRKLSWGRPLVYRSVEEVMLRKWSGCKRMLGDHQVTVNNVSLVNGKYKFGVYFGRTGWEGGELHKETVVPTRTSVPWECCSNSFPFSPQPAVGQFNFCLSLVLFELLPLCWSLEQVGVWVSLCTGPLRAVCLSLLVAFCLSWVQCLLVFTVRCYDESSSWHWYPQLGSLVGLRSLTPLGGTSPAAVSLLILNCHTVDVGPAHFVSLSLLPVLIWHLLLSLVEGILFS